MPRPRVGHRPGVALTVWLVSPAWRRYAVTNLALAQRAWLVAALAARGIQAQCVVVADDENLDIARHYGFHTVKQNNDMLGRRFNDGIQYACAHGAEYVVPIGSDDWAHPDLFARLPAQHVEPRLPTDEEPVVIQSPDAPEIITGRRITLVDLTEGRMRVCEARNRHGVIPWIVPRSALEPSGHRPVPDHQERGIDGALVAGLGVQCEWTFTDPHDLARVDFKSNTNLNSYELITGAIGTDSDSDPWDRLAELYPRHLVDLARETSERTAVAA